MKKSIAEILRLSLTVCLALIVGTLAYAQNNPYKIDDRLYKIYKNASENKINKTGLVLADSLFREAKIIGDKKAQCLAKVIYVQYYFDKHDVKRMEEAMTDLQKISKRHGYEQYSYYAQSTFVGFLLNNKLHNKALDYANTLRVEAIRSGNKYGILTNLRTLGNIHINSSEYMLAIKNYKEAVEYAKANNMTSELAQLYGNIANAYENSMNPHKAIEYANMALNMVNIPSSYSNYRTLITICKAYYDIADYDNFMKYFNIIIKNPKHYYNQSTKTRQALEVRYYLYKNDFHKADSVISTINDRLFYLYFNTVRYRRSEDYENAFFMSNLYQKYADSLQALLSRERLLNYDANTFHYLLDEKRRNSEIEHTQLQLANSELELERVNKELLVAMMAARKDSLEAHSAELKSRKAKTDLEKMEIAHMKANNDARNARIRMIIGVVSLSVAFIIIVMIIAVRTKAAHKLKRKNYRLLLQNESLTKAREEAEEADKMKTAFLQNMSHEIRTPLNAIVGFSQLIAADEDMTEEEKADFTKRIELNSDLVQQMINDILNLTSIESGHYKMLMTDAPVNEMCRDAISGNHHVIHPGVTMQFTTDVDDDYCINTDRRRTVEVLVNLLSNAVKNTESGSITLDFSVSKKLGYATFSVTDTGCGIPADKAEAIFERFFKINEFVQGVGLGLTICRTIAHKLGGTLYLDTSYTGGAMFIFEIPTKHVQ